jgi:hypothetical protein
MTMNEKDHSMGTGNHALSGDTVASQGGARPHLSSDLLSRLRRYAEQNAREPWIPVKAPELLALVECAEELRVIASDCDTNGLPESARAAISVLARLEAL